MNIFVKKLFKLVSVAILATLPGIYVNGYELKIDTDYYGGDLYPIYNINSSLLCMNYCESARGCRLATWCENICYLKDIRTEPSEKLGCISFDMYPEDTTDINSSDGSASGSLIIDIDIETPLPQVIEPHTTEPVVNASFTDNQKPTDPAETTIPSSSSNFLSKAAVSQTLSIISLYYLNN